MNFKTNISPEGINVRITNRKRFRVLIMILFQTNSFVSESLRMIIFSIHSNPLRNVRLMYTIEKYSIIFVLLLHSKARSTLGNVCILVTFPCCRRLTSIAKRRVDSAAGGVCRCVYHQGTRMGFH